MCGYCGAGFRRRTERGKVVWRCATRVEKGRDACPDSPTLKDEEINKNIGIKPRILVYREGLIKNTRCVEN